ANPQVTDPLGSDDRTETSPASPPPQHRPPLPGDTPGHLAKTRAGPRSGEPPHHTPGPTAPRHPPPRRGGRPTARSCIDSTTRATNCEPTCPAATTDTGTCRRARLLLRLPNTQAPSNDRPREWRLTSGTIHASTRRHEPPAASPHVRSP